MLAVPRRQVGSRPKGPRGISTEFGDTWSAATLAEAIWVWLKLRSWGYAGFSLWFHLPFGVIVVHLLEPQPYLCFPVSVGGSCCATACSGDCLVPPFWQEDIADIAFFEHLGNPV